MFPVDIFSIFKPWQHFWSSEGHLNGQQNGQETLHGDFSQIPVLLQQASQKQCSHEKSAPNHHCDPVLPLLWH
ncbi:hypothetical protein CEXT_85821 [Caerostris extrusa]|uniref:Uncharacterized protein n=1 Tax=Caerostris extrusa TaxID=172846 RepID=A0AAV4RU41_CAEEX|nr:hypothetical protein CEXT_85821 [Caerostris extrusa]